MAAIQARMARRIGQFSRTHFAAATSMLRAPPCCPSRGFHQCTSSLVGGPNTVDAGQVPEGKEEDSKRVRPAVPGSWYGGERFVIMFTCSKCGTRTARTVSKVSYNKGVVIIRCPGCEVLHLMADRLGWFAEEGQTTDVVQMLKARGEEVRAISALNAKLVTDVDEGIGAPKPGEADQGALGVANPGLSDVASVAVDAPEGSSEGPTPLDLEMMEGVLDLTEEDIRVLASEGKFLKPLTEALGASEPSGRE